MIDEIIDGLLEAIYNENIEECRRRQKLAFDQLKKKMAVVRRKKVRKLTENIKEIDSIINKVKYRMLIMDIPEKGKKKILQQTIDKFKEERKKLKIEKRKISRG